MALTAAERQAKYAEKHGTSKIRQLADGRWVWHSTTRGPIYASTKTALKKKIKKADRISAWLEATRLAGFSNSEANKLFGKVDEKTVDGLKVFLRPPVEVRLAFAQRHSELLDQI